MNIKEILKLGIFLMVVAAVFGVLLSVTYIFTAPKIAYQKDLEIKQALKEVFPGAQNFEEISICKDNPQASFCVARDTSKKEVGKVYFVSPIGYAGPIEMMVGIDNFGKVTGVKIISSKETPGLGDKAKEASFTDQFKGKTNKDALKAKQDIQAISGATITTQAVADGVKKSLKLFTR